MHQISLMLMLLLVSLMSGCGKGFHFNDEKQEEEVQGQFMARLRPVNSRMGSFKGWANIHVKGDQFWIRIKVEGRNHKVKHGQYIHTKNKCPSAKSDKNHDGYIDVMEGMESFGKMLIPLDIDLNAQLEDINDFPKMRKQGFYYYTEAASIKEMMPSLKQEDLDPGDMLDKLSPGEGLDLVHRTVVIYGVPEDYRLPPSVATFGNYPHHFTIPIACGVIVPGY